MPLAPDLQRGSSFHVPIVGLDCRKEGVRLRISGLHSVVAEVLRISFVTDIAKSTLMSGRLGDVLLNIIWFLPQTFHPETNRG